MLGRYNKQKEEQGSHAVFLLCKTQRGLGGEQVLHRGVPTITEHVKVGGQLFHRLVFRNGTDDDAEIARTDALHSRAQTFAFLAALNLL